VIIGGGPAGMTAAIQLKRYGLDPLVFESRQLGGLLWNANLVENYPGFPGGISGPELVRKITRQFTDLDILWKRQQIHQVDHDGSIFIAESDQEAFTSKVLVLATGTEPSHFPEGLIPENAAGHVFYEVHDLVETENSRIAIVGAGDAAFDYALNLANRDNQVIILNRGTEIKALPLLIKRVQDNHKITYKENTSLTGIALQGGNLHLSAVDGTGKTSYKVGALLGAIGRSPTGPVRTERLAANETYLQSSGALHFIGDLHNGIYRQTAISVGDGLKAAMKIYKFLREEEEDENRS
jgi:thioredoxin reductase